MYIYIYLGLLLAEIGRTTFVPPGRLTQGEDSSINLVVRPYDVSCGCTARHGRGATFSAHAIMPSHLGTARVFFCAGTEFFARTR